MKSAIIAIMVAMALVGCSTGTKYNKIELKQATVVHETIPQGLIDKCTADEPMSEKDYMDLAIYERENYLAKYSASLISAIGKCNTNLDVAKELNKK